LVVDLPIQSRLGSVKAGICASGLQKRVALRINVKRYYDLIQIGLQLLLELTYGLIFEEPVERDGGQAQRERNPEGSTAKQT
jgi:hypothetical protein